MRIQDNRYRYCFVCCLAKLKTEIKANDGKRCNDCYLRHKQNHGKIGPTKWHTIANRWT